jgi:predicted Fe-Mo cluster-binding NifX family protein
MRPDAVVVRAIGRRAYEMLTLSGIKIYVAVGNTLRDVLDALKRGALREFPPRDVHEPMHRRRARRQE